MRALFLLLVLAALPAQANNCTSWWETLESSGLRVRAYERYHLPATGGTSKLLGEGSYGVVVVGRLPKDPGRYLQLPPGLDWQEGTPVAVKTVSEAQIDRSRQANEHEAYVLRRLSDADQTAHLFARGALDSETGQLIEEYRPGYIPLSSWLTPHYPRSQHTTKARDEIARQLNRALQVLQAAKMVHSDLKPSNILINPQTNQILIIDYSLAADVGTRPLYLNGHRGGNPRLKYQSPGVHLDSPAQYSDDAYSVNQILSAIDGLLREEANPWDDGPSDE